MPSLDGSEVDSQEGLVAELEIQPSGSGPFQPVLVRLKDGVLITAQSQRPGASDDKPICIAVPADQFKVGKPGKRRKGAKDQGGGARKYVLKISLNGQDAHGNDKYILDCGTAEAYRLWLSMLQDAIVKVDGVQQIEQLPLVFVNPFDLHIEQRVLAENDPRFSFNSTDEPQFVLSFDLAPSLPKRAVFGEWGEKD